jgi:hypothetical protein
MPDPVLTGAENSCDGGATSTIDPASITTTRSATSRAKPISWVTTIIVMCSAASSFITSST